METNAGPGFFVEPNNGGAEPEKQTSEKHAETPAVKPEDIEALKKQLAEATRTIGTLKGELTAKSEMLTRRSQKLDTVESTLADLGLDNLDELRGFLDKAKSKMTAVERLEHERKQIEGRLQKTEKQLTEIQAAYTESQQRELERKHNASIFKFVDKLRILPEYREDAFRLMAPDFVQSDGQTQLKEGIDPEEYARSFVDRHAKWVQGRAPAGGDSRQDGTIGPPPKKNRKAMSDKEKVAFIKDFGRDEYLKLPL